MRIVCDEPLIPCWTVSDMQPSGLTGTFAIKGHFRLEPDAPVSAAEEAEPPCGDRFEDDDPRRGLLYPSDFAPLKPAADVLLVGSAHAPGQRSVPTLDVGLRVGALQKRLLVSGDRPSTRLLDRFRAPSTPDPYTRMRLSWTRTRGSRSWNPAGSGRLGTPTPNQELLERGAESSPSQPAHFGPVAAAWAPRNRSLGRYRRRWRRERWPWLPEDFDYAHFNAAPLDQRVPGYLRGDEEIELQNLVPDCPVYRTQLPGLRLRCFLREAMDASEDSGEVREVPLVLDTLWIDSDTGQLILVWRGRTPVSTLELDELDALYVASESIADEPASLEMHRAAMADRLAAEDADDEEPGTAEERARELAAVRAELAEMETRFEDAEGTEDPDFAAALRQLEEITDATGGPNPDPLDPDAKLAQSLTWLASAEADLDPELSGPLAAMIRGEDEGTEAIDDFEDEWTRDLVEAALAEQESLAGASLTELDLSALDFSGANLQGARLDGSDLRGCRFTGARMEGARLREAQAGGVDFRGAQLQETDLSEAQLSRACFVEANLADADLSEAHLSNADFSRCMGNHLDLSEASLENSVFVDADLRQADLTSASLAYADFSGARLEAACIEEAAAEGAVFDAADLTGLHAGDGADLRGASLRNVVGAASIWQNAVLDGADLRGAALQRADFSGASLANADLSCADLSDATFEDARLHQARLDGANLLRVSFERASLQDATLDGANAYAAKTWHTIHDGASFEGTNRRLTELGR